jgi:hypothetical protein
MNNQLPQFDTLGNAETYSINPTLIGMQIQALTESLRRLEKQGELSQTELIENESNESQSRLNC